MRKIKMDRLIRYATLYAKALREFKEAELNWNYFQETVYREQSNKWIEAQAEFYKRSKDLLDVAEDC